MGLKSRGARRHKDLELLEFRTEADFERWLEKNCAQPESVWLMFAKKASNRVTLSYEQAREQAIRFGWIDGLINRYDEDYYVLRFSQRRPRSLWSKINRAIAEELLAQERMAEPGRREVDAAKADGRWDRAYDGAGTIEVPDDFAAKLEADGVAKFFASISKANRYSILFGLQTATSDQLREKRMERYLAMLARGDVPHPDA